MSELWTKRERLAEFYRRLATAATCRTSEEALNLLASTLNAVEDEHSGVSYNPESWQTDGRMYPAQADRIRSVAGRSGVFCLHHVRHLTFVSAVGSIEIHDRATGAVVFTKAGSAGTGV